MTFAGLTSTDHSADSANSALRDSRNVEVPWTMASQEEVESYCAFLGAQSAQSAQLLLPQAEAGNWGQLRELLAGRLELSRHGEVTP